MRIGVSGLKYITHCKIIDCVMTRAFCPPLFMLISILKEFRNSVASQGMSMTDREEAGKPTLLTIQTLSVIFIKTYGQVKFVCGLR